MGVQTFISFDILGGFFNFKVTIMQVIVDSYCIHTFSPFFNCSVVYTEET